MSERPTPFLDHPAVDAALRALRDAIIVVTAERGLTFKAVAVIGHTVEVTGLAMDGCDCDGCRATMAKHLISAMRVGNAPDGNAFGGMH